MVARGKATIAVASSGADSTVAWLDYVAIRRFKSSTLARRMAVVTGFYPPACRCDFEHLWLCWRDRGKQQGLAAWMDRQVAEPLRPSSDLTLGTLGQPHERS
jgi:hypothetical protein